MPVEISAEEVRRRLALVRLAKMAKAARGLTEALTPAELDAVLPPVPCLRTTLRQAGSNYEKYYEERRHTP